ncbi:MAG: phosphodiester glycosidase family protein [Candidatus Sericytochromatia bacterium]
MSLPPAASSGLLPPEQLFRPVAPVEASPRPSVGKVPGPQPSAPALPDQNRVQAPAGRAVAPSVPLVASGGRPPEGKPVAAGLWFSDARRTADGGVVRLLTLDPTQVELVPVFNGKGPVSPQSLKRDPGLLAAVNASFFAAGQFLIGDAKAGMQTLADDDKANVDKITDQRHFIATDLKGKVVTGRGGLAENSTRPLKHFLGGFPALYTRDQLNTLDQDIRSGTFAKRADYGGASQAASISRSFVGVTAEGRVLLVAAGSGQQRDKGVTMAEGARLLRELGAVEAYVLDGGGSSTVYVKGGAHAPTDGRQVWSYLGVRAR